MKKFLAGILSVLAVAALCVVMAACSGGDVAGKTYEYSDVEISYNGEIPEDQKETINAALETAKTSIKAMYTGATITFNADGSCTNKMGTNEATAWYKQIGNKVYSLQSADAEVDEENDMYMLVEGNKLTMEMSEGGMTAKIIFVQK